MTKDGYNKAAALVVRLREECTQANDIAACLEQTNDDLTRALAANVDALVKSNAQCAEYLRHNEMLRMELDRISAERDTMQTTLHSELVDVRAALALVTEQRDSLKRTLAEWERADTKPHERVTADDVADHVAPPVLPMCMTCHECGSELINCSQGTNHHDCPRPLCPRTCTGRHGGGFSPYSGPCKSATPVRHE